MPPRDMFVRIFERSLSWKIILSRLGGDARTRLGLLLSSFVDTIWFGVRPSAHALPRTCFAGVIRVRVRGREYQFFVRRLTDDAYFCVPGREKDVHDQILGLLRPGDVYVDVGSNVGYYAVLASGIVGAAGRVIAIEPAPDTAKVLEQNVQLNGAGNATVVSAAAWKETGQVHITWPKGVHGFASAVRTDRPVSALVRADSLNRICADIPRIRLIKIDVEGAELEVLKGADAILARTDYLIVELSENVVEVRELLHAASFEVRDMGFKPHVLALRQGG